MTQLKMASVAMAIGAVGSGVAPRGTTERVRRRRRQQDCDLVGKEEAWDAVIGADVAFISEVVEAMVRAISDFWGGQKAILGT